MLSTNGTFLHVGCGSKHKDQTPFAHTDWQETRLDVNPDVQPDLVGSMTDLSAVADASMDAVYSSHNIEHLYAHEVGAALAEFRRVLKPSGFLLLTCPDLRSIARMIADDKLVHAAYQSSMGPITPFDMLFGHRASIAAGNTYMAHRSGFTANVLLATLKDIGFAQIALRERPESFDLWALATMQEWPQDDLVSTASELIPINTSPTPEVAT